MFNDFCQDLCKLVFKAFEFDSKILQRNTKTLRCESLLNIFIMLSGQSYPLET